MSDEQTRKIERGDVEPNYERRIREKDAEIANLRANLEVERAEVQRLIGKPNECCQYRDAEIERLKSEIASLRSDLENLRVECEREAANPTTHTAKFAAHSKTVARSSATWRNPMPELSFDIDETLKEQATSAPLKALTNFKKLHEALLALKAANARLAECQKIRGESLERLAMTITDSEEMMFFDVPPEVSRELDRRVKKVVEFRRELQDANARLTRLAEIWPKMIEEITVMAYTLGQEGRTCSIPLNTSKETEARRLLKLDGGE